MRDFDPWYPTAAIDGPPDVPHTMAIRICRRCPATDPCLAEAMAAEEGLSEQYRYGIFGGLTPDQRAQLDQAEGDPTTRRKTA